MANAGRWKTSGDVVVEGVERMQLQYFTAGATDGTSDGRFTLLPKLQPQARGAQLSRAGRLGLCQ